MNDPGTGWPPDAAVALSYALPRAAPYVMACGSPQEIATSALPPGGGESADDRQDFAARPCA